VFRGIFTLLLSAAFGFGLPVNPMSDEGQSLPRAIKAVAPSIVQIAYKMDRFPPETERAIGKPRLVGAAGTGFIVSDEGHVVTALHVLSFLDRYQRGILLNGTLYPPGRHRLLVGLQFPNTDTGPWRIRASFSDAPFTVVDKDEVHDLALLKLDRPFSPEIPHSVVKFSVARPDEGSRVAVSGYPLGEDVLVTTSGSIASAWEGKRVQQPVPGRPGLTVPSIADQFLIDIHLNHGNSGGPVYSPDTSAVIGVADAYTLEDNVMIEGLPGSAPEPAYDKDTGRALMTNAGLGVVVPARYVVALLKKNSVKWHEDGAHQPDACPHRTMKLLDSGGRALFSGGIAFIHPGLESSYHVGGPAGFTTATGWHAAVFHSVVDSGCIRLDVVVIPKIKRAHHVFATQGGKQRLDVACETCGHLASLHQIERVSAGGRQSWLASTSDRKHCTPLCIGTLTSRCSRNTVTSTVHHTN
jgi:S1-C subfamily serine protease